ncbi:MAG: 16S rRNA (uracil(1498)-N(3))-methyltransferase [Candidatus Lernaella stagnicola]|nr:16S rRNA (uracil(1498)-N(3))-methyltransferase [Candidatus Lernaella stagnicola]
MDAAGTHAPLSRHYAPYAVAGPMELTGEAAHHLAHVLRARPGQRVVLFDGQGREAPAVIREVQRDRVWLECEDLVVVDRESPLAVTMALALSKGEKPEWICQKVVELGAAAIVVFAAEHSVVRWSPAQVERKLERLAITAQGACAQCGRNVVPPIEYLDSLAAVLDRAGPDATRLALDPTASSTLNATLTGHIRRPIWLIIGPEGGLSTTEQVQICDAGWQIVRFGTRILRTETAAVAALAVVQGACGDLA